jgi:peptidyl-tRNA hydrolase, PTH1 family
MSKFLIAGLGNIGPQYALTRHNIGFMILDRLLGSFQKEWQLGKNAYHAVLQYKGKQIYLIKPTTYMNLSGKAVRQWMNEQKIESQNLLVLCDDLALPFGKIRIRPKGSHGGHNGLRHIEELLGNDQYPRLRFGVGADFAKGSQADYVLSEFSEPEKIQLLDIIDKLGDACLSFCTDGLQNTMNNFNQ